MTKRVARAILAVTILATPLRATAADQQTIDVTAHGVVCDGKTDNQMALNTTLNPLLGPGKTAYFPPAATACLVSQPWSVPNGTTVKAAPGSVFLAPTTNNAAGQLLMLVTNPTAVLVQGLGFRGGGADFGNPASLVVVYNSRPGGSRGAVFERIAVEHARGIGLEFSNGVAASGVRDSRFVDVGNHWKTTLRRDDRKAGISFDDTGERRLNADNFASGNQIADVGLDGISFANQTSFKALDNTIDMANRQHELMESPDYPAGVYGINSVESLIANNVVTGSPGASIDTNDNDGLTIKDNKLSGAALSNINAGAGSNYRITDNTCRDGGQGYKLDMSRKPQMGPEYRPAGIVLGYGPGRVISHVVIAGNDCSDTKTGDAKTQMFGVYAPSVNVFKDIHIDKRNAFRGNIIKAIGGTLTAP